MDKILSFHITKFSGALVVGVVFAFVAGWSCGVYFPRVFATQVFAHAHHNAIVQREGKPDGFHDKALRDAGYEFMGIIAKPELSKMSYVWSKERDGQSWLQSYVPQSVIITLPTNQHAARNAGP